MDQRFESAKRQSVGQLLFKAARLWNESAIARVRALGEPRIRVAHTAGFPHLDIQGGTRVTELAKRMGMSKQGAQQLVDDLEEMGLVARIPDPTDKRASRVVWTERGLEGLRHGVSVLGEMERELASSVGEAEMGELRQLLWRLLEALERPSAEGDTGQQQG